MPVTEKTCEDHEFGRPTAHTRRIPERITGSPDVTLGDLVDAVGSVTDDPRELVLVVRHILSTGKVVWPGASHPVRAADLAPPLH